ncbi:MAG: lysine--tRNA ligase [Candidatus Pacebacteria bacterium]|nr:lysine--tRNA ligase [Candidatus Paceibacterota bacterium]
MIDKIKQARLDKLNKIYKAGIDPYPAKSTRTHKIKKVLEDFDKLLSSEEIIIISGRVRTVRVHGALTFVDLEDQSGQIQLFFRKDDISAEKYNMLSNLDIGDFLQVEGTLFVTKKGEQTLAIKDYKILTKSLLPLPEKWHGLADEELRYRKRYLDLIMNKNTKELFTKRTEFTNNIRNFLNDKGYLEVETPVLEAVPGGADAEPFTTHHNKLDIDLYLRISLELHLKRLLVGGFEKIYEIGKVFRNEGMSTQHLQEFTMLEFYWAYADYEDLMSFVENFYMDIIEKTFGSLEIKYQDTVLNFKAPWPRIDYREIVLKESGVDIDLYPTKEDMQKIVKEKGIKVDPKAGRGRLIDQLYKKLVRPKLIQPSFLIDHPLDISPLAKRKDDNRSKVQRMQVLIATAEVGNGFSELNDPIDQRERFTAQDKLRLEGDDEAQMMDEDFVEALEYGMPPTAGFGVGIDRLFMILTDQESIRDVVFFPTMRSKRKTEVKAEEIKTDENISSNDQEDLELGIDLDQAENILDKYIKDPITKLHCIESRAIMEGVAKRLDQDTKKWGIIGLLHDIDWELTKEDTSKHCIKAKEILKNEGASDFLIDTIVSHGFGCVINEEFKDKKRETMVQHALAACETLTGLIIASTLVQPDKKLNNLTLKSLKKKFKSKGFAANCNREIIRECEEIGICLDDFLKIGLESLQLISDDLNL